MAVLGDHVGKPSLVPSDDLTREIRIYEMSRSRGPANSRINVP